MKSEEIVKRLDAILEVLPKDRTAIEIEKRYAGSDKLWSVFSDGIAELKRLRAELATAK
jgi:hypothetical protein